MRNLICITLLFVLGVTQVNAQFTELVIQRGKMSYNGDLAPGLVNMTDRYQGISVAIRRTLNDYQSIQFQFTTGQLGASDTDAVDVEALQRNLEFHTRIREFSLIFAQNLNFFDICYSKITQTPYVFAGIGMFFFNPTAELDGMVHELQPAGTEGQFNSAYYGPERTPYKLYQLAFPIGFGYKYRIYRNTTLAFQMGWRKTFFDYLDDVSRTYAPADSWDHIDGQGSRLSNRSGLPQTVEDMRGDPKTKDSYMFYGFSIAFTFQSCRSGAPIKCFGFF